MIDTPRETIGSGPTRAPSCTSPNPNVVGKIKEIFSEEELRLRNYISEWRNHLGEIRYDEDLWTYVNYKDTIAKYLEECIKNKKDHIFGKDTFKLFLDYMTKNDSVIEFEWYIFPYLSLFNWLDDEVVKKMIWMWGNESGRMCYLIFLNINCFPWINIEYLFNIYDKDSTLGDDSWWCVYNSGGWKTQIEVEKILIDAWYEKEVNEWISGKSEKRKEDREEAIRWLNGERIFGNDEGK